MKADDANDSDDNHDEGHGDDVIGDDDDDDDDNGDNFMMMMTMIETMRMVINPAPSDSGVMPVTIPVEMPGARSCSSGHCGAA
eukprot:6805017-Karenia_brevis.AAC.1